MNMYTVLSIISFVFFSLATGTLIRNRRRLRLSQSEYIPILLSSCLYTFITFSNILEHDGITAYFDPFEDVSEIVFLFMCLFFINSWRTRRHLEKLRKRKRQLQAALQKITEKEQEYRILVENSNDAICVAQNDKLVFFNTRTVELLGFSREEIAAQPFTTFFHPDDRQLVLNNFHERLAGGTVPPAYTARIISKNNDELTLQLGTVVIEWNRAPATLCFARDITNLRKLEQQLIYSQKMESIGTLAGGVAHDFNNILSAIIGYSELAKAKLKEGPVVNDLEKVLVAGDRAKQLVKQILNISRKSQDALVPVDVHVIILEALKLLRSSIPTTITIKQDIDQDSGLVLSDPTQIHQIIMNLCTNAYHAMRETGGTLAVTLRQVNIPKDESIFNGARLYPGQYVELIVSDTGHGIKKEYLSKIFDPYFTTKSKNEGTGLGLAVVHGIVKAFAGSISVYSEPEKGTTFHIYLPRVNAAGPADAKSVLPDYPKGDERALVVDDEELLSEMIKDILESLGYTVTATTNSKEAVQIFQQSPESFDFVITDMTMPELDGVELINAINAPDHTLYRIQRIDRRQEGRSTRSKEISYEAGSQTGSGHRRSQCA